MMTIPSTGSRAAQKRARAGNMTLAMRAAAAPIAGPKVLRVGIARAGRLVEERVLAKPEDVSVGTSERATFVVPEGAPPCVQVIAIGRRGYELRVPPGARGRVAIGEGVIDLAALSTGARRIALDERSRGSVVVGDTTLLFQFVAPPPVRARPQLPLSVKRGLASQVDWTLAVLAALSFLVHFGLVGVMYSDWGDPVVDLDVTASIVDLLRDVPVAPPVEVSDTPAATAKPAETATATAQPSNEPRPVPAVRPDAPRGKPAPDPAVVAGLLDQAEKMGVALIGGVHGPKAGITLDPGESTAPVDLEGLANKRTPVGSPDPLHGTSDTGPIQPGKDHWVYVPTGPVGPIASTAGPIQKVVPGIFTPDPIVPSVPTINAEAVVRSQIEPRAHACYQRGLLDNPALTGHVGLLIKVAPSGEVDNVTVTSSNGLPPKVLGCVVGAARSARFPAPGPNGANVSAGFGFVSQSR